MDGKMDGGDIHHKSPPDGTDLYTLPSPPLENVKKTILFIKNKDNFFLMSPFLDWTHLIPNF